MDVCVSSFVLSKDHISAAGSLTTRAELEIRLHLSDTLLLNPTIHLSSQGITERILPKPKLVHFSMLLRRRISKRVRDILKSLLLRPGHTQSAVRELLRQGTQGLERLRTRLEHVFAVLLRGGVDVVGPVAGALEECSGRRGGPVAARAGGHVLGVEEVLAVYGLALVRCGEGEDGGVFGLDLGVGAGAGHGHGGVGVGVGWVDGGCGDGGDGCQDGSADGGKLNHFD